MPTSFSPFFPSLAVLPPPQPPPRHFILSRRAEADSIRLVCTGELDLASRRLFANDLGAAQEDSEQVVLDLRELTFIDCSCIAALFAAAKRGRPGSTSLVLLCPRGQVRRMFDLVGSPTGVAVLDHDDRPVSQGPVPA
jgi:anti-sigma B factor antagonist